MHNAVLDISFSDAETVSNQPAGLLTLVYTAAGTETSFQDDDLINATVINLSRDGSVYTPVTSFSVTAKKEFKHYPQADEDNDIEAGTIAFHPDLPAMETGEDSVVNYVPGASMPADVTEPLTLAEMKAWLKVEVDDDEAIIEALIPAARYVCEGFTGLSLAQRTVTAVLRNDLGGIRLPYGPVGDITSMTDGNGNDIASDNYTISGTNNKRLIAPVTNACLWAGSITDISDFPSYDAITVEYAAGYSVCPQHFKTAIKMQCAWMYSHRGDSDIKQVSPDAMMLLRPYRVIV